MSNNYSYSKVETYESCPFKYKLKYVDNNYFFCNSIATEFGTLVHATEEAIAKAIKAGEPINYIKLKNNFVLEARKLSHKYPNDYFAPDKSEKTYEEKARYYLDTAIYHLEQFMKDHPTYEIVGIEAPFEFVFDETHIFKGFIDRVFHDRLTDTYIIQDIKTWAVEAEKDKLTTPLQFVVYVLAAEKLYGSSRQKMSCQYYLPICNCITQDAGTSGFMDRGLTKIKKLFKEISEEQFTPKPTPLCHWCEFCSTNANAPEAGKFLCPYFSHWTRDNKSFQKENNWEGVEKHNEILEAYHRSVGYKK